jgi:hypothetical protein
MTSIFQNNGRRPQFLKEMEDILNFQEIGDNLSFRIWKTTSIFQEMEDNLNFSGNRRRIKFSENGDHLNSISADTKYF